MPRVRLEPGSFVSKRPPSKSLRDPILREESSQRTSAKLRRLYHDTCPFITESEGEPMIPRERVRSAASVQGLPGAWTTTHCSHLSSNSLAGRGGQHWDSTLHLIEDTHQSYDVGAPRSRSTHICYDCGQHPAFLQ